VSFKEPLGLQCLRCCLRKATTSIRSGCCLLLSFRRPPPPPKHNAAGQRTPRAPLPAPTSLRGGLLAQKVGQEEGGPCTRVECAVCSVQPTAHSSSCACSSHSHSPAAAAHGQQDLRSQQCRSRQVQPAAGTRQAEHRASVSSQTSQQSHQPAVSYGVCGLICITHTAHTPEGRTTAKGPLRSARRAPNTSRLQAKPESSFTVGNILRSMALRRPAPIVNLQLR
jgi:hypothetical protein